MNSVHKQIETPQMSKITIAPGFSEAERETVASLYWGAFGQKLSVGLGPAAQAQAFLVRVLNPRFALCARDAAGVLLGVAGYKTSSGALVGGGYSDLSAIYGRFGGAWRALLLGLLERDLEEGTLLMDGVFVTHEARGQGLGTLLLHAIKDEGRAQNCHDVRLDVIDINPRARALYEREGFVPSATSSLGPLKYVFGFSKSTEMRFSLHPHS